MATEHSNSLGSQTAADVVLVDTAGGGGGGDVAAATAAVGPTDALVGLVAVDPADDKQSDNGNKRRFFPRVKHLMTREWEPVS